VGVGLCVAEIVGLRIENFTKRILAATEEKTKEK